MRLPQLLAPALGRGFLEAYVREADPVAAVEWAADPPSAAQQLRFWAWLEALEAEPQPARAVLGLPRLSRTQAAALAEFSPLLRPLPVDAPVAGLATSFAAPSAPVAAARQRVDAAACDARLRAWVQRTLCPGPLNLCPFTASPSLAGVGLSQAGVAAAPILFGTSDGASVTAVLADFWSHAAAMLDAGERPPAGYSSIVLACPAWDGAFARWRDEIFPALEEAVLAAELGRTLGVVCFHPHYVTPSPSFLARRRFGHMYGAPTLRRHLDAHEPRLSAATSDDELAWAGAYMRRSPHAMINVLWSRQLEAAESKRRSSLLYASNLARCLAEGRAALDEQARLERGGG